MGERKTAERQPFISRMEYLRKGTVTCGKLFRGVRILKIGVSSIRILLMSPDLSSRPFFIAVIVISGENHVCYIIQRIRIFMLNF